MHPTHTHLITARLSHLKPTQATVGMHEVQLKREESRSLKKSERKELIANHWFPGVIGPGGEYYIVDHHHLGVALNLEEHESVQLTVPKDLAWLSEEPFWKTMEFSQLAHPYDSNGKRISFSQIPKSIGKLKDDPFRSLAEVTRQHGAYAKIDVPLTEFLWADYFRLHFKKAEIQKITKQLIAKANKLAKLPEARYLPG